MNTYAKLIAAAVVVLVVAVVGFQFLPANGGIGGPAPSPTSSPTPSPSVSLLARGDFVSHGIAAELDATGSGADVAGTMALSELGKGTATVDLECARTTADGLIEIGGLITTSTYVANSQDWHGGLPEGQRVAIILQPGSPVRAIWWVTSADQGVTSCAGMFANMDGSGDEIKPGGPGMDPIQGTVEFGP